MIISLYDIDNQYLLASVYARKTLTLPVTLLGYYRSKIIPDLLQFSL